jgi:hypothetical protein
MRTSYQSIKIKLRYALLFVFPNEGSSLLFSKVAKQVCKKTYNYVGFPALLGFDGKLATVSIALATSLVRNVRQDRTYCTAVDADPVVVMVLPMGKMLVAGFAEHG